MKEKKIIYTIRIILLTLTLVMLCFILGNGIATGETSASQSQAVTEVVQDVVGAINPTSPIATAEGSEFDLLHACVRELAHFIEYFLFGALAFGTFLSFVKKGKWRYSWVSVLTIFATAFIDEGLQSMTAGRAAQAMDAAVDITGAIFGIITVTLSFFALKWYLANRKKGERTLEQSSQESKSSQELLHPYDKKGWIKSLILGFFIGLAVIVPGVSGATVAIILRLYDSFLYAVSNLFKRFKTCFFFLLPIGIGAVIGFLLGFLAVQKLLEMMPFAVIFLFAGLMIGAFPAVKDELNDVPMNGKRLALLIVGTCIPVAVAAYSSFSTLQGGGATGNILEAATLWQVVLPLAVGFVLALTQLVPGLSASAILMLVGWYALLMQNLHFSLETLKNVDLMIVVCCMVIGFVVGFFVFSKLLSVAFKRARGTSYSMIVGLAFGSLLTMFFNAELMKVFVEWSKNGINVVHLILGIVLLILGVVGAYMLVRVQRNHDKKID